MAKSPKEKVAGTRQTLVQYDQELPEIEGRKAHLAADELFGKGRQRWISCRPRPLSTVSKLLLVSRIRAEVDNWRNDDYDGASDTSKRLLEFWFGGDHRLKDGV